MIFYKTPGGNDYLRGKESLSDSDLDSLAIVVYEIDTLLKTFGSALASLQVKDTRTGGSLDAPLKCADSLFSG